MSDLSSAGTVTDATHQPNPNELPPASETPNPSAAETPRPDWLPEKFETPEALVESYKNLEGKMRDKTTEIEASLIERVKAEQLQASKEGVPDDPSGYEIPSALDPEKAKDDPAWQNIKEWSHARNLRQDDVEELVSLYVDTFAVDFEAEKKKIGDDFDARAKTLGTWVEANVPEDHKEAIMLLANSAENFMALEAIMRLTVPQDLPKGETTTTTPDQLDDSKVQELMQSPQYMDPALRDPAVVKQVDEYFAKKYAGQ